MTKEKTSDECCENGKNYHKKHPVHGSSNAVYGLGFIGAVIYFIGHATTFWLGVLGFLKAIVWPVYLVYKIFEFLKI